MSLTAAMIALPLTSAALCMAAWRWPRLQQSLSLIGTLALTGAACALFAKVRADGIQVVHVGGHEAPLGIALVCDTFSAVMLVVTATVSLAVVVYSMHDIDARRRHFGYDAVFQVMIAGVSGAFVSGDLFNLFVWFEVLLVSSFVLLALGGERQQLAGALKYVSMNIITSVLFLSAVGTMYGLTGTLNLADLATKTKSLADAGLLRPLAAVFFVAFGLKSAVFPLFFWLPAAYHTPPVAISAVFAGLLTKVGVYALVRMFTLVFADDPAVTHELILTCASLTMVSGVLGAAAQEHVRRILSFHIISQIGYMIMGLGLFSALGLAGSIYYIAHHIIVKTNLFLVGGVVSRLGGSEDLSELGGLWKERPLLAALFAVPALSLAGTPPLSGFFAKVALLRAGLQQSAWVSVGVALVVGFLTLYSMSKIFAGAFWQAAPVTREATPATPWTAWLPMTGLAAITILLGVFAGPALSVAHAAAGDLLDSSAYVRAVLGQR